MAVWSKVVLLGALLVVVAAYARPEATATVAAPDAGTTPLLLPAASGDGDSWRDRQGREYRLGLVDAPEVDECFGAEATAERQRLTAAGFRADVYATDRYGRSVSVVTLPDGRSLNVHLAREGFADDRHLDAFRDEHPGLAAELSTAFADARRERRGLWGACG